MELKDLRKQTISGLILIIVNKNNSDSIRKNAEIVLKNRIRNLGTPYEQILALETEIIEKRGTDINNYLIRETPTLQQLMEIYFEHKYKEDRIVDNLLFSETHLCNNISFRNAFFDKICSNEITSLEKRISLEPFKENKKVLETFKFALETRQREIIERRRETKGLERFELNEAFYDLTFSDLLSFRTNMLEEEIYRIENSKILSIIDALLMDAEDTFLDIDLIHYLYGYKKVLNDSARLNKQKKLLLNESNNGTEVDYTTPTMQKVYKKLTKV